MNPGSAYQIVSTTRDLLSSLRPRSAVVALLATLGLAAAVACGTAADPPAAAPAPTPTLETGNLAATEAPATVQADSRHPETTSNVGLSTGTGLTYGDPDYDFTAASFNSYWYSRYTLGNLSMMSGMGVPFMPPADAVMGMAQMVDQGPAEGEHIMMPSNPALLRAVYAGGDPQFSKAFNGDMMDLSNYRWDQAKMDKRLTPAAQAQTIIKELEWARFFNSPGWAGAVNADFGAMDRFKGMVMYAGAAQQTMFALGELRNDGGLFPAASLFEDGTTKVADPAVIPGDQYQMLQALSDFRLLLQNTNDYNGVYKNPDMLKKIGMSADGLFAAITGLEPDSVKDLGLGAQAMAWYAASAEDPALQQQALDRLAGFGDALIDAPKDGVIDSARSVRGLLEAARILGDDRYYSAARTDLDNVVSAYHFDSGRIDGVPEIADWELGDILGALNSASRNGGEGVDSAQVQKVYAGLFEAIVNVGGLMQARVPAKMEISPFEADRMSRDIFLAYPTLRTPAEAGGPYGTAAVHASRFRFVDSSGRWEVVDRTFDTAGAMHTSNEMMWTFGLVTAFPEVDIEIVANSDFPMPARPGTPG